MTIGQRATTTRTFTIEQLEEYRQLSGDPHPLYSDEDYARQHGFENRPLAPGMLGGLISYLMGVKLPGRGTNWLKQHFAFPNPSYPGQKISAQVEISRLRPEKDLVNLLNICRDPQGRVVCAGESLVLVKDLEK